MGKTLDFSYKESRDDLDVRINTFQKYGTKEINDWIMKIVKPQFYETVLDLGCGSGKQSYAYHNLNCEKVVGADISRDMIKRCNDGKNLYFMRQDMNKPFIWKDYSFDIVSCCYALYYVNDLEYTLKEMRRVLKPNGRVFICGPGHDNSINFYRLHEKATGYSYENAIERTRRNVTDTIHTLNKLFSEVKMYRYQDYLTFTDIDSFSKYYQSSVVYKECNNTKILDDMLEYVEQIIDITGSYSIKKTALGVLAYK